MITLWLLSALAFADAISMPPDDCPRGAEGVSSHEGAWCEASTCAGQATCVGDTTCWPDVGLCVEVRQVPCGGRRPDTDVPCTITQNEAFGSCETDADCSRGTCVIADRCATAARFPTLGCGGCATAPAGAALAGVVLLALLIPRRPRG